MFPSRLITFNMETAESREKCFQKREMNSLSWSEISSRGRPFSQYQWSKKSKARDSAVRSVVVGMIRMSEPSLSVIVRMQLWPSSSGRGPIKSRVITSHRWSGTGKG